MGVGGALVEEHWAAGMWKRRQVVGVGEELAGVGRMSHRKLGRARVPPGISSQQLGELPGWGRQEGGRAWAGKSG